MWQPNRPQFVVKLTKHCNLRCKYCYEYPYLSDKTKMELPQVEAMLKNIATTLVETNIKQASFTWHGGEPFLLSPEYYRAISALQTSILSSAGIEFYNVVQSNLTILKEGHFDLLKEGLIKSIGVSIDLFGDDRVNIGGKVMDNVTLSNMQRLVDAEIPFATISVLSKKTAPFILKLFNFFDELDVPWRILPIDLVAFEGQHDNNVLTSEEIVEVYKIVFEEWLKSTNAIIVEPINEYIDAAIASLNPNYSKYKFDKEKDDSLFIINTNGDVYSEADSYDDRYTYGNIFTSPLSKLVESPARQRAIERAKMIVNSTCQECPYYGCCNGFRMAESTTEKLYWDKDGKIACTVIRPTIDYIRKRLVEEDLVNLKSRESNLALAAH
jgi:uncharacterized protein